MAAMRRGINRKCSTWRLQTRRRERQRHLMDAMVLRDEMRAWDTASDEDDARMTYDLHTYRPR